jgi:hypothetical protein
MGLTAWLARRATRRVGVLVAEMPGGWRARVEVERRARRLGWRLARSPADADVLVVCGRVPAGVEARVDAVWDQLPGPRARVAVEVPSDADAAIERAVAELLDVDAQRRDASGRPGMDHEGMDHGGMDHGGMDHGGMDMAPDGIPLAEGGDDRDGLEMDELHVRLGPVLAHWPAGLQLTWTLQGDLVVASEGTWTAPAQADSAAPRPHPAAVAGDSVAALLHLAGWSDAAAQADRVRDLVLEADEVDDHIRSELGALVGRVRRSRLLRWSLRGVRPIAPGSLVERGLPEWWAGDTRHRLDAMLDRLEALARSPEADTTAPPDARAVADLTAGLEVATARLVVASLDLPSYTVGHRDPEVARA